MGAEASSHPRELAGFGVSRSFTGRDWSLRTCSPEIERALAGVPGLPAALAHILAARGTSPEELGDIFQPTLKRLMPEPFSLKDMERAISRTRAAIEQDEEIAVFGDYDVDGSVSSALLWHFFAGIGRTPRMYIPDRMTEGYGPNAPALLKLKEEGARLVITVDCGAAAVGPLTAARDAGLDVIVLDHHAVEALTPAVAQVNPNQPGDASGLGHLCAAGVTFLFLVALNRELRECGWYRENDVAPADLMQSLDIVGLATICDVVPLLGVNRAFVRAGLARLGSLERPGLAALAGLCKAAAPFTPYHLGFLLGPRINAGGRVGRCSLGLELLTARDAAAALPLAQALDRHNRERQAIESMILDEAEAAAALQGNSPFVFVSEIGWHPGVVGIVAGRLKDRFGKPAFVAGFEGGLGRGSARSVPGIDIGEAVRGALQAGILDAGGGHAMAAGFSLGEDRVEAFREFLMGHFQDAANALDAARRLDIDAMVSPGGATQRLAEEIGQIGPFGPGNPEPLLALPDVRVGFADVVGRDHVRLRLLGADGSKLDAIAFRAASSGLGAGLLAARGGRIHAAGRLRVDDWNGRKRVQLQIEDAARAQA
jgi:single-stranded-DNA-specific exonuclease